MHNSITTLKNIISSFPTVPAEGNDGLYIFHNTIEGNELAFGGPLKYFNTTSVEPLVKVNDYDSITYRIVYPIDMEGRKKGFKGVRFSYKFDIEVRDFNGFWHVEEEVFKDKSAAYRVFDE